MRKGWLWLVERVLSWLISFVTWVMWLGLVVVPVALLGPECVVAGRGFMGLLLF
jgi:hypothetical protein